MTGEMKPIYSLPRISRLREELEARRQWESQNPELAAAWNAAWREDDERRREKEVEAAREVFRQNMPFRLERMGVPALVIAALGSNVRTQAIEHVEAWKESGKAFLLLLGGVGTGKTVAAASTLIEAPAHSSAFVHALDVARLSDFNPEHAHELDRVTEAKHLVLDDLGTEHANDFWVARLDGIVNHRYGRGLTTIITSNLDAARFKKQYGERIADRIRQVGMIRSCGNESMRRGKQ